ncbi:MAG TPA: amphi-Trp domain-containing protein [Savagea sp.]
MKNKQVQKEVLLDFEQKMSLAEAATFLETIALKLKEEQALNIRVGQSEVLLKPSSQVEFELKVEKRGSNYSFEVELDWDEQQEYSQLEIE